LDGSSSEGGAELEYLWYVGEGRVESGALDEAVVEVSFSGVGEAWVQLTVGARDETHSKYQRILAAPPPVLLLKPEYSVEAGEPLQLDASESFDGQGEALSFQWRLESGEAQLEGADAAIATFRADAVGRYPLSLILSAGARQSQAQIFVNVLTPLEEQRPWPLALGIEPAVLALGEAVSLSLNTQAGEEPPELRLWIDGQELELDAEARVEFLPDALGEYQVIGEALGEDRARRVRGIFTVYDAGEPDDGAPQIAFSAPAPGTLIEDRTEVHGSVTDTDLAAYFLEAQRIGAGPDAAWIPLDEGYEPVQGGLLGYISPVQLNPGMYDLRLRALDRRGHERSLRRRVVISEETGPVGNLSFSLIDFSQRLVGLPVVIRRSYDSFDRQIGEFGYGWSMEVTAEARIETPNGIADNWTFTGDCVFRRGLEESVAHILSFVVGQKRYRFRFSPNYVGCVTGVAVFEAHFIPLHGTPAEAQVEGEGLQIGIQLGSDTFFRFDFDSGGLLDIYEPENASLLLHGARIQVDREDGLQQIQDSHGNELSFSADGVQHSDGTQVGISRDGQGRVTRIQRPDGAARLYQYNEASELIATTDFSGRRLRYFYGPDHLLSKIIGPEGELLFEGDFDDRGRLISSLSDGEATIEYNDDENRHISITPDGRRTETLYDERGRVLNVTRHTGAQASYEYGPQGKPTRITDFMGLSREFQWRADGELMQYTSPLGVVTDFQRDADGRILHVEDSEGNSMDYSYTAGELSHLLLPNGAELGMSYDERGELVEFENLTGSRLQFLRDDEEGLQALEFGGVHVDLNLNDLGEIESISHQVGEELHRVEMEYAGDGRPVGQRLFVDDELLIDGYREVDENDMTVVDSHGVRVQRDRGGRTTALIAPDGSQTLFEYNQSGQMSARTSPGGRRTELEYDFQARTRTVRAPGGLVTRRFLDEADRVIRVEYPDGRVESTEYNELGLATVRRGPNGESHYQFNSYGQPEQITLPTGAIVQAEYNEIGLPISHQIGDHPPSLNSYNVAGEISSRTSPEGRVTHYEYDTLGRLTRISHDGIAASVNLEYGSDGPRSITDGLGRVRSIQRLKEGSEVIEILPSGRERRTIQSLDGFTRITDYDGALITHGRGGGWDSWIEAEDGSRVAFRYSLDGEVVAAQDERGESSMAYDEAGRLIRTLEPTGAWLQLEWLPGTGQLSAVETEGGRDQLSYDLNQRISRLEAGELGVEISYDLFGRPLRWSLGESINVEASYDELDLMRSLSLEGQELLFDERYSYDHDLRAVSSEERQSGRSLEWRYDAINRLIEEREGDQIRGFSYDAASNLIQRDDEAPRDFQVDVDDRLTRSGAEQFQYDELGRLIEITGAREMSLSWDGLDRLIRVQTNAGDDIHYSYDAHGLMVKRIANGEERRFLWQRSLGQAPWIIEEQDGLGQVLARNTRIGPFIIRQMGAEREIHLRDRLGSVRRLINPQGELLASREYSPYGRIIAGAPLSEARPFGFTGAWSDPLTGFLYLQARHYDPETGRFLSRDSVPPDPQRPLTLNAYLYAGGAPTLFVDPGGMSFMSMMGAMAIQAFLFVNNPIVMHATALLNSLRAFSKGKSKFIESDLLGFISSDPTHAWPTGAILGASGTVSFLMMGFTGGAEVIFNFWPTPWIDALYSYYGTTGGHSGLNGSVSLYAGLSWDVWMPGCYEGPFDGVSGASFLILSVWGYFILDQLSGGALTGSAVPILGMRPDLPGQAMSFIQSSKLLNKLMRKTSFSIAWSPESGECPDCHGIVDRTQSWGMTAEIKGWSPKRQSSFLSFFSFSSTLYSLQATDMKILKKLWEGSRYLAGLINRGVRAGLRALVDIGGRIGRTLGPIISSFFSGLGSVISEGMDHLRNDVNDQFFPGGTIMY